MLSYIYAANILLDYIKWKALTFSNFSAVLEEHRKQCEMEGKYVEAEMAKNRISELKIQDYNRRREQLVYDQAREREEVEQAHLMEY